MTKVKYKIRLIKIDGYHQQNYDFYHISKYNQFNSKLFSITNNKQHYVFQDREQKR